MVCFMQIDFSVGASSEGKNNADATTQTSIPNFTWQILMYYFCFMVKSLKTDVLVLKPVPKIVFKRVKHSSFDFVH